DPGSRNRGNERPELMLESAKIGVELDVERENYAGLIESNTRLAFKTPAVAVGEKCFRAIALPFHRPTQLLGRNEHERLLRKGEVLHAEPPADIGSDDAELLRLHPKNSRDNALRLI